MQTSRSTAAFFAPVLLMASAAAAESAPPALATTAEVLRALPMAMLPAAQVQERVSALKHEPLRFAVPTTLNLDLRSGQWDSPEAGLARWRLQVGSEGARSLALRLNAVQLPDDAELWFYDSTGRDVQGPITASRVKPATGELSLPLVRGSAAVLEVRVPEAQRSAVALRVVEAYHGYRGLSSAVAADPQAKAAIGEDAGSCNINVVCTEGSNWRNEIRSTVLLVTTNQSLCTGSLVNNTRQDDRALVLTANHCGIRSSNIGNVTAYFNVESSTCSGNENGRVDQNIDAGSFLARDDNSDFTLITLASLPPAAYNVFYAGWDARSGVVPQSGVTVHHPQGDEKKISVYNAAATAFEDVCIGSGAGTSCDGFLVDAWRVNWSRGTTEGGSSGSGLWNQNRQLVGVLSGGGASCSSPNEPDFFGRLERGWRGNCQGSGNELRAHLDPTGSNCLQLASKNPGSAAPVAACAATADRCAPPIAGAGSLSVAGLLTLLLGAAWRRRTQRHSRAGAQRMPFMPRRSSGVSAR